MTKWILPFATAIMVALGGSYALRSIAYADGAAAVDAGPAGGVITVPAIGTGGLTRADIDDPIERPAEFYADARQAARTSWPAAVLLVLYAVLRAARGRVAWLRSGAAAAYTAGALVLLGAGVDWLLGGGSPVAAIAAALSGIALILDPQAKPGTSGGGAA